MTKTKAILIAATMLALRTCAWTVDVQGARKEEVLNSESIITNVVVDLGDVPTAATNSTDVSGVGWTFLVDGTLPTYPVLSLWRDGVSVWDGNNRLAESGDGYVLGSQSDRPVQPLLPYPTNAIPYNVVTGAPPLNAVVTNSADAGDFRLGLMGGSASGGTAAIAIGLSAQANNNRSVAIGRESIASHYGAIAIGNAVASNNSAIAIGTTGGSITNGIEQVTYALAQNVIY